MHSSLHRRIGLILGTLTTMGAGSGCVVNDLVAANRMKNGLVIVLPGIEGRSKYNADIARGLDDGGVPCAIEIYDWGTPLGALVNLMDLEKNQREASRLADRILRYRRDYPHRPVHLVGHSGGGGMAVLTLEALPTHARVTSVLLLAAAISPEHDLTRALNHTEQGIWNFYSSSDIGYLQVGTGLFGTIDRKYTRAAGAVGFKLPPKATEATKRAYKNLHSVRYKSMMFRAGHRGGHTGWTNRRFVSVWLAPVILATGDGRAGYHIALDDRLRGTPMALRRSPTTTKRRPSSVPTTRPEEPPPRPITTAPATPPLAEAKPMPDPAPSVAPAGPPAPTTAPASVSQPGPPPPPAGVWSSPRSGTGLEEGPPAP